MTTSISDRVTAACSDRSSALQKKFPLTEGLPRESRVDDRRADWSGG